MLRHRRPGDICIDPNLLNYFFENLGRVYPAPVDIEIARALGPNFAVRLCLCKG